MDVSEPSLRLVKGSRARFGVFVYFGFLAGGERPNPCKSPRHGRCRATRNFVLEVILLLVVKDVTGRVEQSRKRDGKGMRVSMGMVNNRC